MAFSGAAPEVTNGRLAMLGFVSAVAAELASGESVLKQWSEEPTGECQEILSAAGGSAVWRCIVTKHLACLLCLVGVCFACCGC